MSPVDIAESREASCSDEKFTQLLSADYWRNLNPALHLCDQDFVNTVGCFEIDAQVKNVFQQRVVEEGYFDYFVQPSQWQIALEEMAEAVRKLLPLGLMPVFAFVYDEFWLLYAKQAKILGQFLGEDYWMLPDFWVWHVDPKRGEFGWRPHRDKGRMALYPDGTPKSLTVWVPLTASTPTNGCMYIVPANRDKTYNSPAENDWQFDYPDVRALPGQAGNVFVWNQAVLHWGSRTSRFADVPRISVAFEFQRANVEAFNHPLLSPRQLPSFEFRVKLIAKQLLQYNHMYPLGSDLERFARKVLET